MKKNNYYAAVAFPDGFPIKGLIGALKTQFTYVRIIFDRNEGIIIKERTKDKTFMLDLAITKDKLLEYIYQGESDSFYINIKLVDIYPSFKTVKRNYEISWEAIKTKKASRIIINVPLTNIRKQVKGSDDEDYTARTIKKPEINTNLYKCTVEYLVGYCNNALGEKSTITIASLNSLDSQKREAQGISFRLDEDMDMADNYLGSVIKRDKIPDTGVSYDKLDEKFEVSINRDKVKTLSHMAKWASVKSRVNITGTKKHGGIVAITSDIGTFGNVHFYMKNDPDMNTSDMTV